MNILQKLTLANLRENKRRTIVTIVGVMLSAALILAVVGIVTSFRQMMINFTVAESGDFHDMFEEVPADKMKYIEDNIHVSSYYYSKPFDRDNLPENMSEDTYDFYELYQNTPYKTAYYEKLTTLPTNNTQPYNIYVRYDNPRNYESIRASILEALGDDTHIGVRTNSDLLRYEAGIMGDAALSAIISLAVIVIVIIIVTSIFVIRNSFSISATERARQFGMLASIGATPRQIRQSVLFEGAIIGLIGIPLGMILGVIAVVILVMIMNILMQGITPVPVPTTMPLWIFPAAIILSFATIFLSSLMPAIRAAKVSPIEAIRSNQDIKIKAKKVRTSKLTKEVFGIGGVIASKNLKRSRKKYRTTVISIVLSVATFVGLYSFLDYGKQITGLQYSTATYDLEVGGADVEFYKDLIKKFGLKDSVYYEGTRTLDLNVTLMEKASFEKFAKSLGINSQDYSKVAILNDFGIEYNNETGQYQLVHHFPNVKAGDEVETEVITKVETQKVNGSNGAVYTTSYDESDVETIKIPITELTDKRPLGYENMSYIMTFVSEDYYLRDQLGVDSDRVHFVAANVENLEAVEDYLDDVEESGQYKEFYYTNVRETLAQSRRLYLLISIFLYGFITVVTLIGVTNIFNTITTNIALRAREFATLKSIGMTSREFKHMIRLESLMYVGKALLIGLPLGVLLSYGFYQGYSEAVDFGYQVPWVAIVLSIVAVGVLISAIMRYSVKQVEKQNIIETIRSENI